MIGIGKIAVEIPESRLDAIELGQKLNASEAFLAEKLGMRQLARMPQGCDTSDLAAAAAQKLLDCGAATAADLECIAVVTQNPDGHGLPHTAAILHGKLGLPKACLAFDISVGCSGFVAALSILRGVMRENCLQRGLLITADPYSKILDEGDRDTVLIFGDAATATLLSDQPIWNIGRFDFGTAGEFADSLSVRPNGKLAMNGRSVFNFVATEVPQSIQRTLDRNALTMADIDRVVLHQGSRYIVDTLANRLGAREKVQFCCDQYGNTVSSSIPIILASKMAPSDRRVIISGFGVGLSWATTVLERAE
jgi:3-oxoacyl-[acyl-carrier-protein] synthase III